MFFFTNNPHVTEVPKLENRRWSLGKDHTYMNIGGVRILQGTLNWIYLRFLSIWILKHIHIHNEVSWQRRLKSEHEIEASNLL